MNNKAVFVSIFCKIYTDNFSEEMVNRQATGQEIYEFLLREAQQCFNSNGEPIPGDCNLWYLGCNEKFGHLALEIIYGPGALVNPLLIKSKHLYQCFSRRDLYPCNNIRL